MVNRCFIRRFATVNPVYGLKLIASKEITKVNTFLSDLLYTDVPHVCASPVWEIHETGCPPSSSAQTPVTHSWSSPLTSGRSIDIGLKTTCATPAENKTSGETAATSSDGSIKTDLNTTDMPSFRYKSGTSAKKESCDFGISATSLDVDANQVITKSSRFADIFSPSLNEVKEQESTGDSLSHSRVSLRIDEVEARQNSSACERRSESPSKNTQSHDKCSVNPLTNSLGLKQSDFENTSITSCCCDGKAYIENEASPSCSKSFGFVAKMSTGLENSNLVSKSEYSINTKEMSMVSRFFILKKLIVCQHSKFSWEQEKTKSAFPPGEKYRYLQILINHRQTQDFHY